MTGSIKLKNCQMKTILVILFLSIFQTMNAQDLTKSGNQWNIKAGGLSPFYTTYGIKIGELTDVGGVEYRILLYNSEYPVENWQPNGQYLRQEDQKVYLKNNVEEEILLYDFGLKQGDVYKGIFCDMEVLMTDSITLVNGEKRKRLKLLADGIDNIETFWIEGIGSSEYGLLSHPFICATDYAESLLCFYEDADINYPQADAECVLLKIREHNEVSLNIYPNPTTSSFKIRNSSGLFQNCRISDINGRQIISFKLEQGEQEVENLFLSPGFYTIILSDYINHIVDESIVFKNLADDRD